MRSSSAVTESIPPLIASLPAPDSRAARTVRASGTPHRSDRRDTIAIRQRRTECARIPITSVKRRPTRTDRQADDLFAGDRPRTLARAAIGRLCTPDRRATRQRMNRSPGAYHASAVQPSVAIAECGRGHAMDIPHGHADAGCAHHVYRPPAATPEHRASTQTAADDAIAQTVSPASRQCTRMNNVAPASTARSSRSRAPPRCSGGPLIRVLADERHRSPRQERTHCVVPARRSSEQRQHTRPPRPIIRTCLPAIRDQMDDRAPTMSAGLREGSCGA